MALVADSLPRYRCHKEVRAFKIAALAHRFDDEHFLVEVTIFPTEGSVSPLMPAEWFWKHRPEVGGYFVVYDDGYCSYSPAASFENGYTRIA